MALIFITHDISIVGNLCDRLAVFYGGVVVETGPKDQVLNRPKHPYTQALIEALPILGSKRGRLRTIQGYLPHAGNLPPGCPFHPRCEHAMEICMGAEAPPAFQTEESQFARCWLHEESHDG